LETVPQPEDWRVLAVLRLMVLRLGVLRLMVW
jgi:hypothetical protein